MLTKDSAKTATANWETSVAGLYRGVIQPFRRLLQDLEREPQVLVLLLLVVSAWSILFSALRPFWFDELFTYYLSGLPLSQIWPALRQADLNPPLTYWLTHASLTVFGAKELATRLPAILGFLLMALGLGWFVRRRSTVHYALAAVAFPMLTAGAPYAAEARPYGLLLGFGALSLVAWQYAAEGRNRRFAVPFLLLTLSAAILSHYYAVFLIGAIGFGELVRAATRRRIDWAVAACLGISLALGFWLITSVSSSMVVGRSGIRSDHFLSARLASIPNFYDKLLLPAAWPLLGAALIVAAFRGNLGRRTVEDDSPVAGSTYAYEWAGLSMLALVPILVCLSAIFRHDIFVLRHGILGLLGLDLLVILGVYVGTRRSIVAGVALSTLFVAGLFVPWIGQILSLRLSSAAPPPTPEVSPYEKAPPDLPLVVSNGLMFMQAQQYEPKSVTDHLFFVTDPVISLRETGTDIFDAGLYSLNKWHRLHGALVPFQTFRSQHRHFYVYGLFDYPEDWLIRHLLADSCSVRLVSQSSVSQGSTALLDVACQP